jgi:hypothetical protein
MMMMMIQASIWMNHEASVVFGWGFRVSMAMVGGCCCSQHMHTKFQQGRGNAKSSGPLTKSCCWYMINKERDREPTI